MVDQGADMPLHQFADPLEDRLLKGVARRRPVELVNRVKPAKRHQQHLAAVKVGTPGPLDGDVLDEVLQGGDVGVFVMHREQEAHQRQKRLAGFFEIGVGVGDEVCFVLLEGKKAEPLGQFHAGAGLGLFRRAALAHLLLVADHHLGILAADAEIDRDIEPAVVDAAHLLEDVQLHLLEPRLEAVYRFDRAADLVLVHGILFEAVGGADGGVVHGATCI